jgi:hypothetical protein
VIAPPEKKSGGKRRRGNCNILWSVLSVDFFPFPAHTHSSLSASSLMSACSDSVYYVILLNWRFFCLKEFLFWNGYFVVEFLKCKFFAFPKIGNSFQWKVRDYLSTDKNFIQVILEKNIKIIELHSLQDEQIELKIWHFFQLL